MYVPEVKDCQRDTDYELFLVYLNSAAFSEAAVEVIISLSESASHYSL